MVGGIGLKTRIGRAIDVLEHAGCVLGAGEGDGHLPPRAATGTLAAVNDVTEGRSAYWDPLPTARDIAARWQADPVDLSIGTGKWEDRSRLNVPGPFYTGDTDDGLNGQVYAPGLVLCGSERGMEFVYRQPQTPEDVEILLEVAWGEPMGGYAWDGDQRWSEGSVREWWSGRAQVREWIRSEIAMRSISEADYDRESVPALLEFAAHLDGPLEHYLRGYVYWLIEGREPDVGAVLPEL